MYGHDVWVGWNVHNFFSIDIGNENHIGAV